LYYRKKEKQESKYIIKMGYSTLTLYNPQNAKKTIPSSQLGDKKREPVIHPAQ
jgi:hypothetical protein